MNPLRDPGVDQMRTTEQLNSFLQLAREQSVAGEVLRRRLAAAGAITLGFCGFLLAIGLAAVVVVFFAALVVSVGLATLITVWPRLRTLGSNAARYVRDRGRATRAALQPRCREAVTAVSVVLGKAQSRGKTVARAACTSAPRVGRALGETTRATTVRFMPRAAQLDPAREAIRLNATGAQQRREGRYEEAAECHRQALEILRRLGDARGVALTQSNLALALSHAGDDVWAVGLFEEAAATLRALGDEEHEAQIMANLGVTHRRHGRSEEADNILQLALSKLTPASSAYQAIEAELRRAS